MTDSINIKKRLVFIRGLDSIIVDEGNNFEASFDIDEIGGNLNFELPYIKSQRNQSGFNLQNLQKFDYVFLYYAQIESDREPKNEEWFTIFSGYIEKITLEKNKDSNSYKVNCSSLIALSNYAHVSQGISFADGDTQLLREVPYLILQKINLQSGPYNYFRLEDSTLKNERDIIPIEWVFIAADNILSLPGSPNPVVFNGTLDSKNGKEAIEEFKDKFGLIFHQNMDGTVQVTSLTNYLINYNKPNQIGLDNDNFKDINFKQRILFYIACFATGELPINPKEKQNIKTKYKRNIAPKLYGTYDWIVRLSTKIRNIATNASETKAIEVVNPVSQKAKYLKKIFNSDAAKFINEYQNEKDFTIDNVFEFDITKNIFDLDYPDFTTVYDAVIVYGTGQNQSGKALDLASIALKDIPQINGKYNVSTYVMYKDDVNNREELDEIARNKLYELKQDNKVTFKTMMIPNLKVGMPFVLNDYDKYTGEELFFVSRISYTISKSDVYMEIEGRTSLLNLLPQDFVTSNRLILDVDMYNEPQLREKIEDSEWQNF